MVWECSRRSYKFYKITKYKIRFGKLHVLHSTMAKCNLTVKKQYYSMRLFLRHVVLTSAVEVPLVGSFTEMSPSIRYAALVTWKPSTLWSNQNLNTFCRITLMQLRMISIPMNSNNIKEVLYSKNVFCRGGFTITINNKRFRIKMNLVSRR